MLSFIIIKYSIIAYMIADIINVKYPLQSFID
jgi:hypothetical protein